MHLIKRMAKYNFHNILCIRLDNMGDLLMTQPAIRAIRNTFKEGRISLLSSSAVFPLATLFTEIDEVITYDAPWVKNDQAAYADIGYITKKLKKQKFDAAVIFTVYSQSALPAAVICYEAGIPFRIAYSHENSYKLLSVWVKDPEPQIIIRHEVERQLELVKFIGCETDNDSLMLETKTKLQKAMVNKLGGMGVNPYKPWIILHPGVTSVNRQYPVELFAETVQLLHKSVDCEIIFCGTVQERDLILSIQKMAKVPSCSLAGLLDIENFITLLSISNMLISNNSGPVHMSAGVGTPVVVLYALTNIQHTPWKIPNQVIFFDSICTDCKRGMCFISHKSKYPIPLPEEIISKTMNLFRTTSKIQQEKNLLRIDQTNYDNYLPFQYPY